MAGRRLGPEERALWLSVVRDVVPLPGRSRPPAAPRDPIVTAPVDPAPAPPRMAAALRPTPRVLPPAPRDTLDASWDRRLAKGLVGPDMTLDLHGHTLAAAHAALDAGLAGAVSGGARLILLVTGRAPTAEWSGHGPRRGAIRAAVGDWLATSRFTDRIAAVRNAHPRHGGSGALYVILRRVR